MRAQVASPSYSYCVENNVYQPAAFDTKKIEGEIKKYLFYEQGKVKCCFTVFGVYFAVSHCQGHHSSWEATPEQPTVVIVNQDGQKFETNVVEVDPDMDFVVVKSTVPLVDKPPTIEIPQDSERYILMGYPNQDPDSKCQALHGAFMMVRLNVQGQMLGSCGSSDGYNGGPIFDFSGQLLGVGIKYNSSKFRVGTDCIHILPAYFFASRYRLKRTKKP